MSPIIQIPLWLESEQESPTCRSWCLTGKSILVVEDEWLIALNLSELLERNGYRIMDPVESGEQALEQITKSPPPDLILMDIKPRKLPAYRFVWSW